MILAIYSGYIAGGVILYILFGMPWFDALNHSICAVATGGFSTKAASIGYYDSVSIEMITIILMILGSTNFLAHLCFLSGKPKNFFAHCEMHLTILIYATFIPLSAYFLFAQVGETVPESIRIATFHAISALSTTGFQIVPGFSGWPSTLFLLLTLLMLAGGHAGSTSGGIKQLRLYILFKSIIWYFRDALSSGRMVRADFIQKPTEKQLVTMEMKSETSMFIFVYLLVFLLGSFFLCMHGFDLKEAMFEYSSAMGGVGLSAGITSYDADPSVLWSLSFGMFVGRLEIFVVIIAFLKLLRSAKNAFCGV
ncbi:MAG: potassium transporter TrkG [Eubacteriales bacterium]|nr:potassium transporter TrkG [Eubacteriales bacterium]